MLLLENSSVSVADVAVGSTGTAITASFVFWADNPAPPVLTYAVPAATFILPTSSPSAKVTKPIFSPQPADDIIEVFNLLQSNFPFAKFCIYQGEIISPLQHHLSSNRIIYVETERDSAETIFDFLKGEGRPVFLRPGKDIVYRYVDMDSRTIFVKNLVSEAPLQEVSGIPMPTLEKLMVDILRDSDFFYLQGSESEHIIENAFRMYSVNRSRLFRYSNRRKVKDELLSILNNLNLQ